MQIGKISNEDLNNLIFNKIGYKNKDVIVGAGIGEDCCEMMTDKGTIVVSGDPITAAKKGAGALAIYVTANDISAAGAYPVCAVITVLLPVSSEKTDLELLFDELTDTASKLNIEIAGGHTEVTPAVNQPVINVTMIGKTYNGNMIPSSGAKPGDSLVISKSAAIEGTLIIADDFADKKEIFLDEFDNIQLTCMRDSISVMLEGKIGAKINVHAMHDITEGGVIGAVRELCDASGVGANTDITSLPVLPVTSKLCNMFSINPYMFISSGSMLFSTDNPDSLIQELAANGIDSFIVGSVVDNGFYDKVYGAEIFDNVRDELYKLLGVML